jgi:hypothetical protein
MPFLEIALRNAARGFRVHPTNGKVPIVPGWPELATTDPATIEQWAAQFPHANCGVAVGPDLCVLESDDLAKLKELLNGIQIPATYTVQARDNRPHFYFRQTAKTTLSGNRTLAGIFEFKQNRLQVVGEGSTHPCGAVYRVIDDSPIVAMPDELMAALLTLQRTGEQGKDAAPVEGNRNNYLTSVGGKLRSAGLGVEALKLALLQHNDDVCMPPLSNDEVEGIATSVARYAVPEPVGEVVIGEQKKVTDWRERYLTLEQVRQAKPISFLIDGFLALDSITALAAPVGQRKSLIALNVAHALCTGQPLFDYFKVVNKPHHVAYLCPEMGLSSFSTRLKQIGLLDYVGKNLFCQTMDDIGVKLAELDGELPGAVVIVDTITRFVEGDQNSSEDMSKFAQEIFRLKRLGATVLLLHHSVKGTGNSIALTLDSAMRGSTELAAFVTCCWATRLLDTDEPYKSASLLVNVKQRDFESKPLQVISGPDCRLHIMGEPGQLTEIKKQKDVDAEKVLAALLKDSPNTGINKIRDALKDAGFRKGAKWVGRKRAELLGAGVTVGAE